MAVTYGFYDSVGGDRTYNALQMSSIFDGIINDGIFAAYGGAFAVTPGTGMQLSIAIGRAWFDHTWTHNDSVLLLSLDPAHALQSRIDIVVLEVNKEAAVRANSIKIVKGTNSASPVPPTLTNTPTIKQYPLAHVLIGPNVTSIIQANITNKIGTTSTPFVTGPLNVVDSGIFISQWESEFMTWFDEMEGQLSTDAAGNLQLQINNLDESGYAHVHERKGGDPSNWRVYGSTIYTPTFAKIQVGSHREAFTSRNSGQVSVTFPSEYIGSPLVFVSILSDVTRKYVWTINQTFSNPESGFMIDWKTIDGVNTSELIFSWMAIGPAVY